MVDLGNILTDDAQWLIDFVRSAGAGVLASNSGTGYPESAYVNVAATDDGRIVFGTNVKSRKFSNITSDPRVSMVIMRDGTLEVQLEGEATVLEGLDAAPAAHVLTARHPGATDTNNPENLRMLEIAVRWATRTDASQVPPRRDELTLR